MVYLISVTSCFYFSRKLAKDLSNIYWVAEKFSLGAGSQSAWLLTIKSIQPIWIALKGIKQWVLFEPLSCNGWIRMPLLRINSDFLYSTQPNLKYE